MIEELCEYLKRRGWGNRIANEVHDVYLSANELTWPDAIRKEFEWIDDDEHHHMSELIAAIHAWRRFNGINRTKTGLFLDL